MMVAGGAAMVVAAYLVGAIPVGVLLARRRGLDLRAVGSGNIGATNVGRALGRRWGLVCLVLDIGKGLVPTAAAGVILHARYLELSAGVAGLWVLVGLAAVLGHVFPVFLGFSGGKGVATSIGVGLGVFPYLTFPMALAVVCYLVVRGLTGYVSAGSLALATTFPLWFLVFYRWLNWPMADCWPLLVVSVVVGVLIIVRHWSNITRLVRGQEHKSGTGTE